LGEFKNGIGGGFLGVLEDLHELFKFNLSSYNFLKIKNILFIKGLKSLRQLLGAKNVVALFLPNFLLFIYIFRKWLCILFIKGLKSLRQLFGAENVVED